jgi:hypothetical protein
MLVKSNVLNISLPSPSPTSPSASPLQEWLTYKNDEFNVRVKYLSTWTYELKNNPLDSLVVFFPKEHQDFEIKDVRVAVSVEQLLTLPSLIQYVDELKKEILKDNEDCKLIEVKGYLLANSNGRKITFEFKRNDSIVRKVAFVTLRNKRAYIIYYEAKPNVFPQFEQIAEDMARSLQVENPKGTSKNSLKHVL